MIGINQYLFSKGIETRTYYLNDMKLYSIILIILHVGGGKE